MKHNLSDTMINRHPDEWPQWQQQLRRLLGEHEPAQDGGDLRWEEPPTTAECPPEHDALLSDYHDFVAEGLSQCRWFLGVITPPALAEAPRLYNAEWATLRGRLLQACASAYLADLWEAPASPRTQERLSEIWKERTGEATDVAHINRRLGHWKSKAPRRIHENSLKNLVKALELPKACGLIRADLNPQSLLAAYSEGLQQLQTQIECPFEGLAQPDGILRNFVRPRPSQPLVPWLLLDALHLLRLQDDLQKDPAARLTAMMAAWVGLQWLTEGFNVWRVLGNHPQLPYHRRGGKGLFQGPPRLTVLERARQTFDRKGAATPGWVVLAALTAAVLEHVAMLYAPLPTALPVDGVDAWIMLNLLCAPDRVPPMPPWHMPSGPASPWDTPEHEWMAKLGEISTQPWFNVRHVLHQQLARTLADNYLNGFIDLLYKAVRPDA